MSNPMPAAATTRRAPVATLVVGLAVGISAVANGVLTIIYATSDIRFIDGVSYWDRLDPSVIDDFGSTSRGLAFWLDGALAVVVLSIGLLIGLVSLIGLASRSRFTSTAATLLGVLLVLAYAAGTAIVFTESDFFEDYFIEAGRSPYGLWTSLLVVLAVLLVLTSLIARAAGAGNPTVPTSAPEPASFQEPPPPTIAPTRRPFADLDGTYFIEVGGTEYGPYDAEQIASFADEGRIVPASLIRPADGFFQTADRAPGLFDD